MLLSLLGVASVLATVDALSASLAETFNSRLYPSADYQLRNAASRTDGYWPYIANKEEPPQGFSYGEFPLPFFSQCVDRMCEHAGIGDRSQATFCDVGSGTGRLVLWAAASDRWKSVAGVELLPSLHRTAVETREKALELIMEGEFQLQTDPWLINLHEGSFEDGALLDWDEIDVCFAYTTAFPSDENNVLVELTAALKKRLRAGCIVATTDYHLGDGFQVIEHMSGENEGVGGVSTAYIHRKISDGEESSNALREHTLALESRVSALEIQLAERDQRIVELVEEVEELRAERQGNGLLRVGDVEDDEFVEDLRKWASDSGYEPGME